MMTKERFIVRVGTGCYRDKPNNRYPEGRPHHKPIYIIWDKKPKNRSPKGGIIVIEEDKTIAEKKCAKLNAQEDF